MNQMDEKRLKLAKMVMAIVRGSFAMGKAIGTGLSPQEALQDPPMFVRPDGTGIDLSDWDMIEAAWQVAQKHADSGMQSANDAMQGNLRVAEEIIGHLFDSDELIDMVIKETQRDD